MSNRTSVPFSVISPLTCYSQSRFSTGLLCTHSVISEAWLKCLFQKPGYLLKKSFVELDIGASDSLFWGTSKTELDTSYSFFTPTVPQPSVHDASTGLQSCFKHHFSIKPPWAWRAVLNTKACPLFTFSPSVLMQIHLQLTYPFCGFLCIFVLLSATLA